MIRFFNKAFITAVLMAPLWVPSNVTGADNVLVVTPEGQKVFRSSSKNRVEAPAQKKQTQSGPNIQWQILDQMEQLQQEVQMLRGKIEEQAYEIDKIKQSQRDRYIDLDRRLSELNKQPGSVTPPVSQTPVSSASPAPSVDVKDLDDRKLYNTAQDMVQSRQFDQAIATFNHLFEKFPESRYVPNSHYWLGEVYMALPQPKLAEAKAHLLTVIESYPDHSKVPASLYKLGKTSDMMGDKQQAIKYLKKVLERYPSSSSAGLARQYIQNLMAEN